MTRPARGSGSTPHIRPTDAKQSADPEEIPTRLTDLPPVFRARALLLRRYGGTEGTAVAWEVAAADVERGLLAHDDERLAISEAAVVSGYTLAHFRRMVREGKVPQQPDGTVLRRHVPVKPGSGIAEPNENFPCSRTQLARGVAGGE